MHLIYQKLRKYPISILCIATIWILSLIKMPETEFDTIEFIDKWVHVLMYGGTCSVIWIEYLWQHRCSAFSAIKLFIWTWLMPILMSGTLELLQEYCTTSRSGDWLDLAANATGVTLAALIMIPISYFISCKRK